MTYIVTWSDPVDGEFRRHSGRAADLAGILADLSKDVQDQQYEVSGELLLGKETPISVRIECRA